MVPIDCAKTVLGAFFTAPSRPRYIREIAGGCELSYERVQHYLKELEKVMAVASKTRGKIKEYSLNRQHDLVLKSFSILEMERRQRFYSENPEEGAALQAVVRETSCGMLRCLLLFGSTARSEAGRESDVDLLFVMNRKDAAFVRRLTALAKRMGTLTGKRYSVHHISLEELKSGWKREPFYTTLWRDHIVLYGDEEFSRDALELGEP